MASDRAWTRGVAAPVALWSAVASAPKVAGAQAPALVVLIAVDQMRGDYVGRWGSQWTGGFARFWNRGTVYLHGRQDHAATETAPGHSTMLSGREPASTGVVTNSRGVPDPRSPVLGMMDTVGASPRRFPGTTLDDS